MTLNELANIIDLLNDKCLYTSRFSFKYICSTIYLKVDNKTIELYEIDLTEDFSKVSKEELLEMLEDYTREYYLRQIEGITMDFQAMFEKPLNLSEYSE